MKDTEIEKLARNAWERTMEFNLQMQILYPALFECNEWHPWESDLCFQRPEYRREIIRLYDGEKLIPEQRHHRIILSRIKDGWRHGPVRDDRNGTDPGLVAWPYLSPEIRLWCMGKDAMLKTTWNKRHDILRGEQCIFRLKSHFQR